MLSYGKTARINFKLSEASFNFGKADVSVSGGVLSNWKALSSTKTTATFRPTKESTKDGIISVRSGVFTDSAGNANDESSNPDSSLNISIDSRKNTGTSRFAIQGRNSIGTQLTIQEITKDPEGSRKSVKHTWQAKTGRNKWQKIHKGDKYIVDKRVEGQDIRVQSLYKDGRNTKELTNSESVRVNYAELEAIAADFNKKTIRIYFEGKLKKGEANPKHFSIQSGRKKIKISSITTAPKSQAAILKATKALAASENLLISYRDPRGNQDSGIIENASGVDTENFSNLMAAHAKQRKTQPHLTSASLRGNKIALEFDHLINNNNLSKKSFQISTNTGKITPSSAKVQPNRRGSTTALLTIKSGSKIEDDTQLTLSYQDRNGDQDTGVIQNIFGNDLPTINHFPITPA